MTALQTPQTTLAAPTTVLLHTGRELEQQIRRLADFVVQKGQASLSGHPAWLMVLRDGLGHVPYCLEATRNGRTCGILPLAYVRSLLFGRFLVSLPYLNSGGVLAEDENAAHQLIDGAVQLAESLNVRYLELRHEQAVEHPGLVHSQSAKVHMRLPLPPTSEELWQQLDSKVRNQVRKARKNALQVVWGGRELLRDFFAVFSHNMRDLGTPTYGRRLFATILDQFPERAEFCVVRNDQPLAAALLLHGNGVSEVPSASSLRAFNHTCANMLLYWHLLDRAIERRHSVFDFGRCTQGGPTYRFKEQWGATPTPTQWQYGLRRGSADQMRPENPRYQRFIRLWRRLPLRLTQLIGPWIVRGIP